MHTIIAKSFEEATKYAERSNRHIRFADDGFKNKGDWEIDTGKIVLIEKGDDGFNLYGFPGA